MSSTESNSNRKYWESWNSRYSNVWKPLARQEMSKKETRYIVSKLPSISDCSVLDVGVGNGRILDVVSKKVKSSARIYGIDISKKMVEICQRRFKNNKTIKKITVCDLSMEDIPYGVNFDFVSVIRVLKYNKDWKKMLKKIFGKLNKGGVLVFTMPNNQSVSSLSGDTFSDQKIPIIHSNPYDLKKTLRTIGFNDIEVLSFSKVPNFLYHISSSRFYVKLLLGLEKFLELVFGKTLFGRELFVSCRK